MPDALPIVVAAPSLVWEAAEADRELRQGEVVTSLVRYDYSSKTGEFDAIDHATVLILTQDCDLLGDFESRSRGGMGELDHLLLLSAVPVGVLKESLGFSAKEMKPLHQNLNPRFHYLEACSAAFDAVGAGMDGVIVDFRSVFAVPTAELYRQCAVHSAQRRSRLKPPYREHLQLRATQFMARVILPAPHMF